MALVEKWRFRHMNKLVERKAFIDAVMVKSTGLKDLLSLYNRWEEHTQPAVQASYCG